MSDQQMLTRFTTGAGFIAALDQSGGSTPKALRAYGIDESQYSSEAEMFDLIHAARSARGAQRNRRSWESLVQLEWWKSRDVLVREGGVFRPKCWYCRGLD